MVAAAQGRYCIGEPQPYQMFGILVVADQFAFVRSTISAAYLESLENKMVPPKLKFQWWPKEENSKYPNLPFPQTMFGIPFGNAVTRETIVKTLCLLQRKFIAQTNPQ